MNAGPSGWVISIGFWVVRAGRVPSGPLEVGPLGREREDALVDQLDHLGGDQVDVRHQAVDRVRPDVVAVVELEEGQAAHQAAALLAGQVEAARR